jgi:hypothetical protein
MLRRLLFLLPTLTFALAGCVDTDVEPATDRDLGMTEGADELDMREEVMADQLAEMPPLRRALRGDWRDEIHTALLDFEGGRYEGVIPYGGDRGYERVEGDLRVLDEGDDYVTFEVDGAHTLTARQLGDDQIIITAEGADEPEGVTLRRR